MGPVESVIAKAGIYLSNIETADIGVVILKFRNGGLGIVETATCARPKDLEGSISILGAKGAVEIGGFAVNEIKTWEFEETLLSEKDVFEKYSQDPSDVYGFGYSEFLENVVQNITGNRQSIIDGIEGRKSLELLNSIYESIETGKEVYLRFIPRKMPSWNDKMIREESCDIS